MIELHEKRVDTYGVTLVYHLWDDHGVMPILGVRVMNSDSLRELLEGILEMTFAEKAYSLRNPIGCRLAGSEGSTTHDDLRYVVSVQAPPALDDAMQEDIEGWVRAAWGAFVQDNKFLGGALVPAPIPAME